MLVYSLMGNSQKLDGGAMYGHVPKKLWEKWSPPDELNRIKLSCRCLLLETNSRLILFETGVGAFFSPEMRGRYGVEENNHVLLESLKEVGFAHEDITDVIVSHLHFDHAGGLLAPYEPGKPAELLFPKARYHVGKKAFKRATVPHQRDKASFIAHLPALLKASKRLELHSSEEDTSIRHPLPPQITFRFSDGHTPGLMLSQIKGPQKTLVFASDLIPGTPRVHLPITMGYDRFPEKLVEEKEELLSECEKQGSFLFYTHDPEAALSQVRLDSQGKFIPFNNQKILSGEKI